MFRPLSPSAHGFASGPFERRRRWGRSNNGTEWRMEDDPLVQGIKWAATISGIVAAFMVSLDSGRRVTGWGFVIFVGSSIAWITASVMAGDGALGTQNAVLFGINIFGVYRYLIRKVEPGEGGQGRGANG